MANDIAAQVREKMERLEAVVVAMDNLASLATVVDNNTAHDYADLHHFCSVELSERFAQLQTDLRERVLPFVAGVKSMRLS